MYESGSGSSSLFYARPTETSPPPPLDKYNYPGAPVELGSVYPPPPEALPSPFPHLPSAQRKPIWDGDSRIPYSLTTHIVPTAYLREDEDAELPEMPLPAPSPQSRSAASSKEERKSFVAKAEEKLREIRRGYEDSGRKAQQKVLWLCLNRYVRTSKSKGGYTLFFAHANGFHKEAWEPTLLSLLSSEESQSLVQEIWVWDVSNHGDSALLNKGKLNSLMHTRTSTRDLLNFLIYFLPTTNSESPLPTHLPQVSESEVKRRVRDGFIGSGRLPVCGFGHSFGGAILTLAAISHPSLFTSLGLIDPVIRYPDLNFYYECNRLALGALSRRAFWSSREEARNGFLQSDFFKAWDPRVLELYLEAGLYHDTDGADGGTVRLKTPPIQEAIIFNDSETGASEAWVRLWKRELDPMIKLKWIIPGPGKTELDSRPNASQQRVWLRPENCSNVRMEGAGHLMAQEQPDMLGKELERFLIDVSRTKARL